MALFGLETNRAVHHPTHYNAGTPEVLEIIKGWGLCFIVGNVVKYLLRAPHKGRELEDLQKAQFYLQQRIDAVRAQMAATNPPAVKVDDHKRGLYKKWNVARTDGSSEPGCKHHACECFVLDVNHDPFAIPALMAYADHARADYPRLAADILLMVEELGGPVDMPVEGERL